MNDLINEISSVFVSNIECISKYYQKLSEEFKKNYTVNTSLTLEYYKLLFKSMINECLVNVNEFIEGISK